jgi:predicted RNA-binding Zn-ribbon protein involved in translation (DUF1610 family)
MQTNSSFRCPHCGYDKYREEPRLELYNKNGEFVEGYGHTPVYRQVGSIKVCTSCGWREGGNPEILPRP